MFSLTSPEIAEQGPIPIRYTADGENILPPLSWSGVPEGTKSFALTFIDLDMPVEETWNPYPEIQKVGAFPGDILVHWIICDIPSSATSLAEGASNNGELLPPGAKELTSELGVFGLPSNEFFGPAPPVGHRAHKYSFVLYALNVATLELSPEAIYTDFINALKGKVLATASLTAYFGH
jgi:hypothetical protein